MYCHSAYHFNWQSSLTSNKKLFSEKTWKGDAHDQGGQCIKDAQN
jgi:hypothetical protein